MEFNEQTTRWSFAFYLVVFLGHPGPRAFGEARGTGGWGEESLEVLKGREGLCGRRVGTLPAPGPHYWFGGFGMEASLQGLGRVPCILRCFLDPQRRPRESSGPYLGRQAFDRLGFCGSARSPDSRVGEGEASKASLRPGTSTRAI